MQEVGLEGPRMRLPGQNAELPFYYQQTQAGSFIPSQTGSFGRSGPGSQASVDDRRTTLLPDDSGNNGYVRSTSILRHPSNTSQVKRNRGESLTEISKRMDFSLGMKDVSSGDMMGDLYESVSPARLRRSPRPVERNDERPETTLGRTTSRTSDSQSRFSMKRTSSDPQSRIKGSNSTLHRNRFFSRRNKTDNVDGAYDDLMEQGMADIPESSAPYERIDRQSGVVSPQAVKEMELPVVRTELELVNSRSTTGDPPSFEDHHKASRKEDNQTSGVAETAGAIEMRRIDR